MNTTCEKFKQGILEFSCRFKLHQLISDLKACVNWIVKGTIPFGLSCNIRIPKCFITVEVDVFENIWTDISSGANKPHHF